MASTPRHQITDDDAWSAALIVPTMALNPGNTYNGIKLRMHRGPASKPFWATGTLKAIFLTQAGNTDTRYVTAYNEAGIGSTFAFLISETSGAIWHSIDVNNGYFLLPPLTGNFPSNHPGSWPNLPTSFPICAIGVNETWSSQWDGLATPDVTGDQITNCPVTCPSGAFIISNDSSTIPPFFFTGSTPYNAGAE
jgi:hypothetical protein